MEKSRLGYCLLASQGKFSEASPEADCKGRCVLTLFSNQLQSTYPWWYTFPCKILRRLSCGLCFTNKIYQGTWREKEWTKANQYLIIHHKISYFCLMWPAVIITVLDPMSVTTRNSSLKPLKQKRTKAISFREIIMIKKTRQRIKSSATGAVPSLAPLILCKSLTLNQDRKSTKIWIYD